MEWLQLLLLALIQGLTEFLPISSSAHLILPAQLFGWQDQGLAFDIAVHVGTLLAVMIYYRRYLANIGHGMVVGLRARQMNPDLKLGLLLLWATLPAVFAGALLEQHIASEARSMALIAGTTIGFGLLLWLADARGAGKWALPAIGLGMATVMGLAQALALVPGVSRSGITITAALLLGMKRQDAANFSFLMSIPVIAGAVLLMLLEPQQMQSHYSAIQLLSATLLSALVAYFTISFFIRLLERLGMLPFVVYRLLLGGVLLLLL